MSMESGAAVYGRREFLKESAAFAGKALVVSAATSSITIELILNTACSLSPRKSSPQEPLPPPQVLDEEVRRAEGAWTKEDIERIALSMMTDKRFRFISRAGEALYKNQQGQAGVSLLHDLFSDDEVSIETVRDMIEHDAPEEQRIVMAAFVEQNRPAIIFTLKGDGKPDLTMAGGSSLRLDKILISKELLEGKSDFLFKLILAKEMYNIPAIGLTTEILLKGAYEGYIIPEDELGKKAARTASITRNLPDGTPLRWIADFWAHFAVIPDYLLAKDLGLLTEEDQKGLLVFDTGSDFFKQSGVLIKKEDNTYGWIGDDKRVLEAWYKVASTGYKALIEKPR